MAVLRARNGAAHQQQLAGFVDANDVEVLRGLRDVAELAGHLLAREHAAGVLRHRDRTRHVVRAAVAVRRALRAEVVALDRAGEALADRGALHVDHLANSKGRHRNLGARLEAGSHVDSDTEFLEDFTRFDARFREVAGFGFGHARCFARAERHLDGAVAVGLWGLDLGDAVVRHVKHGHGNGVAIVREDAHHAHLAAQQSETIAQTHGFSPASEEAFVSNARHRLAGLTDCKAHPLMRLAESLRL